jgi:hypothetical protein
MLRFFTAVNKGKFLLKTFCVYLYASFGLDSAVSACYISSIPVIGVSFQANAECKKVFNKMHFDVLLEPVLSNLPNVHDAG